MQLRSAAGLLFALIISLIAGISQAAAEGKPRYLSGDNYNASQFSAPGLGPTFSDTIKMLIGRDVDSHPAKSLHNEHDEHGGGPGHSLLHSYNQTQCSTFCRTVPGGLDPDSNEAYEACLGPCFKCAQISIRAQAEAGSTEPGEPAFQACYTRS
jgi:hypothetical protein